MAQITKTCLHICEIDSQYPDQTNTGSCDCGYYTGKVNNCFFDFDSVNDDLPAGSKIDSAYLKLSQVSGGYSATENIDITLRSGSWYVMTWNNQAPNTAAGTVDASLSGSSAGLRTFTVTSLIQWIVDNNSTAHIIKLARDPNTASGTLDAKRFSATPGNHSLEINYTAPPYAPTIGVATRVSDTQATISWTNNATSERPYTSLEVLRRTNGGSWTQIASLSGTATSYTDTTTSANNRYEYEVRAVNSAGSATSEASNSVYMTPAAPSNVSATKTGTNEVTLAWTDNSSTEEYFEVRRRVDGGSWSTITSTVPAGQTSYVDSSVPSGTVEYGVRAYRGSLYSDWSANSNPITTQQPPAAPTITSSWGQYSHTGTTLRISWQHNTLDGSGQTAADIYYTIDGSPTTYHLTGSQNYYDIPISGVPATKVVTAKVRTYGLDPDPGPYSAVQSTTLADDPQAVITTPATNGAVVQELPLVVGWDYTDEYPQASWTLQLYRGGQLSKTWTGTTETSQQIGAADLPNGSDCSLTLTVRSSTGFTGTAQRTFTTDYIGPTAPSIVAEYRPDTLSVQVVGAAGEVGELPATDHLVLLRIDSYGGEEETVTLADPLTEQSVFIDYVPRLDQDVTYRLLAVAESGAYSYADAVVSTVSNGACAVN